MTVNSVDEIKRQQNSIEAKETVVEQTPQDASTISVPVGQNSESAQKVVSSTLQSTSVFTGSAEKQQSVKSAETNEAITVPIGQKNTDSKKVTGAAKTAASVFTSDAKGVKSQSNIFQNSLISNSAVTLLSISDSEELTVDEFVNGTDITLAKKDKLATAILSGKSEKLQKLLSMKYTRRDFKKLFSEAKVSAKTAGIDFDKLTAAQKKMVAATQLAFNKGIIDGKELLEITDTIANTDLVQSLNEMQVAGKSNLSEGDIASIKALQRQIGRFSYFNLDLGSKMAPTDEKRADLLKTATSPEFVQKQVETRAKEIQDKVITEKTSASVAKTLISSVSEGFTTVVGLVKDNVSTLCKGIAGLAQTVLENISNVLTNITKTISNIVEKFWETTKGKIIAERTKTMRKIVHERRVEEKKAEVKAEEAKETALEAHETAEEQAKKTARTIEGIKSNLMKKYNIQGNPSNEQLLDATKQTSTNDYLAMKKSINQQAQAEHNANEAYWDARFASTKAFFATMARISAQLNLTYKAFYASIRL